MLKIMSEAMRVDWTAADPPLSGITSKVDLTTGAAADASFWGGQMLAVRATPGQKKNVAAMFASDLLVMVRRGAMRCAVFRSELERMVASLPPVSGLENE